MNHNLLKSYLEEKLGTKVSEEIAIEIVKLSKIILDYTPEDKKIPLVGRIWPDCNQCLWKPTCVVVGKSNVGCYTFTRKID